VPCPGTDSIFNCPHPFESFTDAERIKTADEKVLFYLTDINPLPVILNLNTNRVATGGFDSSSAFLWDSKRQKHSESGHKR